MMIANHVATTVEPAATATNDIRTLRRLRIVTRRRIRIDVDTIGETARIVSDGELAVGLEMVSLIDPRVLAWCASREVDLVVVHDGCGARVVGSGGLTGRIKLPGALGDGAFLAFCYDAEPGPSGL
ncbi:MAG TPA: hypothetical protein VIZ22_00750 [Candidatus Limnocylindrales bacterium]